MSDPVLHVIAGPTRRARPTFDAKILAPATHVELVNAERERRMQERTSFATETVFSHDSKVTLLRDAQQAGYRVTLHIVLVPVRRPRTGRGAAVS